MFSFLLSFMFFFSMNTKVKLPHTVFSWLKFHLDETLAWSISPTNSTHRILKKKTECWFWEIEGRVMLTVCESKKFCSFCLPKGKWYFCQLTDFEIAICLSVPISRLNKKKLSTPFLCWEFIHSCENNFEYQFNPLKLIIGSFVSIISILLKIWNITFIALNAQGIFSKHNTYMTWKHHLQKNILKQIDICSWYLCDEHNN